jgi:hypothetical protein
MLGRERRRREVFADHEATRRGAGHEHVGFRSLPTREIESLAKPGLGGGSEEGLG